MSIGSFWRVCEFVFGGRRWFLFWFFNSVACVSFFVTQKVVAHFLNNLTKCFQQKQKNHPKRCTALQQKWCCGNVWLRLTEFAPNKCTHTQTDTTNTTTAAWLVNFSVTVRLVEGNHSISILNGLNRNSKVLFKYIQ